MADPIKIYILEELQFLNNEDSKSTGQPLAILSGGTSGSVTDSVQSIERVEK